MKVHLLPCAGLTEGSHLVFTYISVLPVVAVETRGAGQASPQTLAPSAGAQAAGTAGCALRSSSCSEQAEAIFLASQRILSVCLFTGNGRKVE